MEDRPIEVVRVCVHFMCMYMYMYTVCIVVQAVQCTCTSHQGTSIDIVAFLSTGIFSQSKQRRKKSKDGGGGVDGGMSSSASGGVGGAVPSFSFSADGDDQTDPATIVSTACVVSYGG